jgi:hypothetical protein
MKRTAKCCFCLTGTMRVVDACYGMTGGEKWGCDTCKSYAVTHDGYAPERAKQEEAR